MPIAVDSTQNLKNSRCLLLGCTKSKKEGEQLSALQRYDGPTFRVLRKFLREANPELVDLDVYVLSARYGLIPASQEVANYDLRMSEERALELHDETLESLQKILKRGYDEVLVALSRTYMRAVEGYESFVPDGTQVIPLSTTMGRQLALLKSWLYKTPVPSHSTKQQSVNVTGSAVLRGVSIVATPQEVSTIGRRALENGKGDPSRFRKWYTLVDGKKVSTKWLASQLSGLHVSDFDASEARRVLQQLGIEVHRDG